MMDFVKGYGVDGDPAQLAFAIKNADANAHGKGDEMVSQMVDYYAEKLKA